MSTDYILDLKIQHLEQEIEKLKAENEELKRTLKHYTDDPDYALIKSEENIKLREMVKRARPELLKYSELSECDFDDVGEWMNEAKEILDD